MPTVILVSDWGTIRAAHPAYLLTLVLVAALGAAAVASALMTVRPATSLGHRATTRTWIGRVAALVGVVAVLGALWWLRPLGATSVALEALQDGDGVTVETSARAIELRPDDPHSTGLVFYPGAKVDPRAYAAVLRPLAEAGYLVVILKLPYNIAFFAPNAARRVIDTETGIDQWVVAGHSLGGTVAARYAGKGRDDVVGLLLWASYPAGSLAAQPDLAVMSVSGTADGLVTPDDVEASKADLPANARFVAIDGATHAFFGDYGTQRGDGSPTIPRADAQRQIALASEAFLAELDAAASP